jgi:hypothetical protein
MIDEVPVEVRFPVTPPDRIALAERDLAFIHATGRMPQAGGMIPRIPNGSRLLRQLIGQTLPGLVL